MYDFANLLFSGPCNARCHFCIGQEIDLALQLDNLNVFPPKNFAAFVRLIQQHKVRQVVFTGTNTDPQLYQHEARLLTSLRQRLHPETGFSLHTNGRLAHRRMDTFNQYDRVTLSFPSFNPVTYRQMMGVSHPPSLAEILQEATVPVKISCLVTNENAAEIPDFLQRCQALGVPRIVLRKRFGETRPWDQLMAFQGLPLIPQDEYRNNRIYDYLGIQVTLWDFEQSTSESINLFASGVISENYLLTESQ
jgi:molybdenum cofactor biosynthesis enzyme MoaA